MALAGPYVNFALATGFSFDPISAQPVLVSGADFAHTFGGTDRQQVAEPATLLLLSVGLAGLGYRCRSRWPEN